MDEARENYVKALQELLKTPLSDITAKDAQRILARVQRNRKQASVPVARFGSSI